MKALICCLVLICCAANVPVSAKENNTNCAAVALMRECSGCSARGQKAVLEVIENLSQIEHQSVCKIVKSSRFPWSKRQKLWKPSKESLQILFRVRMMLPVVGKGVIYFNNSPFRTFGKFSVKIEQHYFYYEG